MVQTLRVLATVSASTAGALAGEIYERKICGVATEIFAFFVDHLLVRNGSGVAAYAGGDVTHPPTETRACDGVT